MNQDRGLGARCLAEGLGAGFLVATVVGSGIQAELLSPDDLGLQLLESSTATALALVALILCFGPVSGAHLNPAVTLAQRLLGNVDSPTAIAYTAAQVIGGCAGAMVANLMFDLPVVELSDHDRLTTAHLVSEVAATFGLVMVILGVARTARLGAIAVAVGGYIGAAYWFTSSTSFANPAVTVARTLSDTFAGIAPASAPAFVAAQVAGAVAAVACARVLFPQPASVPDPFRHRTGNGSPSTQEAVDA